MFGRLTFVVGSLTGGIECPTFFIDCPNFGHFSVTGGIVSAKIVFFSPTGAEVHPHDYAGEPDDAEGDAPDYAGEPDDYAGGAEDYEGDADEHQVGTVDHEGEADDYEGEPADYPGRADDHAGAGDGGGGPSRLPAARFYSLTSIPNGGEGRGEEALWNTECGTENAEGGEVRGRFVPFRIPHS